MDKTKSYEISKNVVWEAYKRVKANKGACGIDDESLADFEKKLKPNLYKMQKSTRGRESSSETGSTFQRMRSGTSSRENENCVLQR